MVRVTYTTYSSSTSRENLTSLSRRELNYTIAAFARSQLSKITSRTNQQGTLTWTQLNVVNYSTNRNVLKRKSVTDFRCCVSTRHQSSTYLQSVRSNNVTFFTISVEKKCNASRAVWIILDCLYYSWNTIFLSLEVYQTILPLMTAAHVADSHFTGVVSTTG